MCVEPFDMSTSEGLPVAIDMLLAARKTGVLFAGESAGGFAAKPVTAEASNATYGRRMRMVFPVDVRVEPRFPK